MDAANFYAILRYEEASLALRAVLRMNLVERLAERCLTGAELQQTLGLTQQAARTYCSLLQVMEVLHLEDGKYRVTELAAKCLTGGIATSRKPYLSMGTGAEVDAFIDLLRGKHPQDSVPLYSGENSGETLMDETDVAREIAFGLSSRARNFAAPLASAVADHAPNATSIADIGAGSPYVVQACLHAMPRLEKAVLVDRENGMRFAREIIETEQIDTRQLSFHEGDFFHSVPDADIYLLSNTAHDWGEPAYSRIIQNIRRVMPRDGLICIHEPLLMTRWKSDAEWKRALWMACYALTLLRLTLGEGTCYTLEEHHTILKNNGFRHVGDPTPTSDGCTALFYRLKHA